MPENLLIAFGLTLLAGLATGIGSILAFLHPLQTQSFSLGCLAFQQE